MGGREGGGGTEGHRWKGEGGKLSWRLEGGRRLYRTGRKDVAQRMGWRQMYRRRGASPLAQPCMRLSCQSGGLSTNCAVGTCDRARISRPPPSPLPLSPSLGPFSSSPSAQHLFLCSIHSAARALAQQTQITHKSLPSSTSHRRSPGSHLSCRPVNSFPRLTLSLTLSTSPISPSLLMRSHNDGSGRIMATT